MSKVVQQADNTKIPTHTVDLKFGYEDKETPELKHRRVRFGRRPTGADFMKAAEESGNSDIQFSVGLMQTAIVEFGEMSLPVPLTVLLSLNQIDRELLTETYFSYLVATGADSGEILEDGKVRLGFGFERKNKKIFEVQFGRLLTGYDEIEIESEQISFWQANALRISKEIISPTDLTVAEIEALDVDDFTLLRNAEEAWLNSFRKPGADVA